MWKSQDVVVRSSELRMIKRRRIGNAPRFLLLHNWGSINITRLNYQGRLHKDLIDRWPHIEDNTG